MHLAFKTKAISSIIFAQKNKMHFLVFEKIYFYLIFFSFRVSLPSWRLIICLKLTDNMSVNEKAKNKNKNKAKIG